MQDDVSVPMAAQITGIPERTIRNWIKGGKLAARRGDRGHRVRVSDVRAVAAIAGRESAWSAGAVASAPVEAAQLAVPREEVQRGAAIIQEAMRPLVEEIGGLREELGRERARREAAERALADREAAEREERRSWWRRTFGG
jgi:hypothetical protein